MTAALHAVSSVITFGVSAYFCSALPTCCQDDAQSAAALLLRYMATASQTAIRFAFLQPIRGSVTAADVEGARVSRRHQICD